MFHTEEKLEYSKYMWAGAASSAAAGSAAGLKKAGAKHESFILNKKTNIANACGQEQHHQQQEGEQQV